MIDLPANGYTMFDTGEFDKIHDSHAAGIYIKLQMLIQQGHSVETMDEAAKKLVLMSNSTLRKVLKSLNYLIANEIKIIDSRCNLSKIGW